MSGLRVGLVGATGLVGRELASVLGERSFPLAELVAYAGKRSVGEEVEVRGEAWPVEDHAGEPPSLRGLDLVFVCCGAGPALGWVRQALRDQVPCIDVSGALAASPEVPLVVADANGIEAVRGAPAIAAPSGPALAWAPVLSALRSLGLPERIGGTLLLAAGCRGRHGIHVLSEETLALLTQRDVKDPTLFPAPLAFDCLPEFPVPTTEPETDPDPVLAGQLERLLGAPVAVSLQRVRVPAFVGEAGALELEWSDTAPEADAAAKALDAAPGVDWSDGAPTLRMMAGRDDVAVAGARRDVRDPRRLTLWVVSDPVHRAASNAVRIAEARVVHH